MKLRRAVLIVAGAAVIAAVIAAGAAVLFYSNGATQKYRECVALMWDRKHPEAVKQRRREAILRECEADQLRKGYHCDCSATSGSTRCPVTAEELRQINEEGRDLIPNPPGLSLPCDNL